MVFVRPVPIEQEINRFATDLGYGLADGREAGHSERPFKDAVKSDHRQIVGDAEAQIGGHAQDGYGLLVSRRKNRSGSIALRQETLRNRVCSMAIECGAREQTWTCAQSRLAHRA